MRCHIIHCPLLKRGIINPICSVWKRTASSGVWLETLTSISLFLILWLRNEKFRDAEVFAWDYKVLCNRTRSICVLVYYTTSIFWVFYASMSLYTVRQLGSVAQRFLQLTASQNWKYEDSVKVALLRMLGHPFASGATRLWTSHSHDVLQLGWSNNEHSASWEIPW